MPGPMELILLAALASLVIGLILGGVRAPSDARRWAAIYGLTLDGDLHARAEAYLKRGRRFRTVGAIVGLVVPGFPEPFNMPGLQLIAGYLVGALLAELTLRRPAFPQPHAALLAPRTVKDYLPTGLLVTLRSFTVLCLGGVGAYAAVPQQAFPQEFQESPPLALFAVAGAGALITAVVVELALRALVKRPQPVTSPEGLALDDALRATSAHIIVAAGTALTILILAGESFVIGRTTDVQLLRWIGPLLAVGLAGVALGTWIHIGHPTAWRVRRSLDAVTSA